MVTAVRVTVLKKRAALEKEQKPAKKSKERPGRSRPAAACGPSGQGCPASESASWHARPGDQPPCFDQSLMGPCAVDAGAALTQRGAVLANFPVKTRRYLLTDGLKRANLLGSMYVRVHRTPASAKLPKHAVVEECADLR
jgi:hypothetical protein